jgi:hypothetical protein
MKKPVYLFVFLFITTCSLLSQTGNTLSSEELKKGWVLLFDDKSDSSIWHR